MGTCHVRKTQQQFENEVYELYGDEYKVIGEYINNKTKIRVHHEKCDRDIEVNPYSFLHGHGCKKCSCIHLRDERRKTTEQFQKDLDKKYNFEYEVVSEYDTAKTDVTIRHKSCGTSITKTPNQILTTNISCPVCGKYKSKGEQKIKHILDKYDICFETQKKYSDLLGVKNHMLSYDFYLPKENILLEYQGEYHDGTARNQTDEEFKTQQEHDKRKREYAKSHNIKLLEIWYWDFNNIEEILTGRLALKQSA